MTDVIHGIPISGFSLNLDLIGPAVKVEIVNVTRTEVFIQSVKNTAGRYFEDLGPRTVKIHENLRCIGRIGGKDPPQGRVLIGGNNQRPGCRGDLLGRLVFKGQEPEVKAAGGTQPEYGRRRKGKHIGR